MKKILSSLIMMCVFWLSYPVYGMDDSQRQGDEDAPRSGPAPKRKASNISSAPVGKEDLAVPGEEAQKKAKSREDDSQHTIVSRTPENTKTSPKTSSQGSSPKQHPSPRGQVYSIPTRDGTFKHMMSHADVLLEFLQVFIPDEKVTSIYPLNLDLTYGDTRENAHQFIKKNEVFKDKMKVKIANKKRNTSDFQVTFQGTVVEGGSDLINGFYDNYADLVKYFPTKERKAEVDVLCRLADGSRVLVEVQVVPQDYWKKRVLAYASRLYSRQAKAGSDWKDLERVICISILGGGPDNIKWGKKGKRGEEDEKLEITRFTVKDQYDNEIPDGIEMIQYPLFHESVKQAPEELATEEQRTAFREWIDLFERARYKTEEDMKDIKTPIIKKAYEAIKDETLPERFKKLNQEEEDKIFAGLSEYLKSHVEAGEARGEERGEARGKAEGEKAKAFDIAKKMLRRGRATISEIAEDTGLSEEEITQFQQELLVHDETSHAPASMDLDQSPSQKPEDEE